MPGFILAQQPISYNSKHYSRKRDGYSLALAEALKTFNKTATLLEGDLYGMVYYFCWKEGTDADNISKPIWDCLKGTLFADDN